MDNLVLYSAAFFTSMLLIHFFKNQAHRIGLVDYPCDRKRHCGEVPLVGGVAIFAAFAISVFFSELNLLPLGALLVGSLVLVAVGVMDDIKALKSRPKFLAQIIAAGLMCVWGGVVLRDLGTLSFDGSLFTLGSLAIPFTIFATVGVINAINMSDGIDGLSGSLTLVALTGLAIATYMAGAVDQFLTIMLLLSAVAAFLVFNIRFPGRVRALVFLGDAGSMFIGFALTWFVVSLSQGESRIIEPATALWFLAMPLFDTVGIMLRRLLKGRSPFAADREHFHHAFQLAGFSVLSTQVTITMIATVCMGIGLAGHFVGASEIVMFYLFLGVFGIYFWGMLHAWKVMRFLRRTMHHDKDVASVALEPQSVVVASQIVADIKGSNKEQTAHFDGEEKAESENIQKVALKLVVNSDLTEKSDSTTH